MSAQPDDRGLQADAALELQIDAACERMSDPAATDEESREAWCEMAALIGRRSHTQVIKMEIERRLLRRPGARMKHWTTNGTIRADLRYPKWLKFIWYRSWMPTWAVVLAFNLYRRVKQQ